MREWWTAADLASRALPGIPSSKRGVNKLAQREGWPQRRAADGHLLVRSAKAGGVEYHVTLLPEAARIAVAAEALCSRAPENATAPTPASDALTADARMAILGVQRQYAETASLTLRKSDEGFALAYNSGRITVDDWVRAAISEVSARTLRRWRGHAEQDAGRLSGRQGRGAVSVLDVANEGAVAELIGGALARQPHLTAAHVRALVRAAFGDRFEIEGDAGEIVHVALPQERAFRRFIAGWKAANELALTKLTNPDRFKSHFRVSGLSRYGATLDRLNQVWEVDASPADMLCTDGRYQIYALVDVWSRRMLIFVTRTPRAEAVLLLVRKAILAWGVPETVKTDNGSDFKATAVRRAFASLAIAHELCDPFSPEQKGIVERAIGTVQRGLMPTLPGFVGHSVAERKVIEQRKAFAGRLGEDADKAFGVELTAAELQSYADRWSETAYGHSPHASLPDRMSPHGRAASFAGKLKRIDDVRALDVLLAPVPGQHGIRTVGKQGLKIDGAFFISTTLMPGEKVLVRHDPQDMGRVLCFSPDGAQFMAEAICPERIGVDRAKAVMMARAEQTRIIKEQVEPIRRAAKRIKPRDMIDAVLRVAEADARAAAKNVFEFPRPTEVHSTPALTAAAEAAAPKDERVTVRKLSAEDEAAYRQLLEGQTDAARAVEKASEPDPEREAFEREFARSTATPAAVAAGSGADADRIAFEATVLLPEAHPQSNVVALPDAARLRARRAYSIEIAMLNGINGRSVSEEELVWFNTYRFTPEYRSHRAMIDDFGPEWLMG